MSKLLHRLLFLFRRRRLDRELDEEMRFHLEMKARANRQAGLAADEAAYAARRDFGNPTLLKEASREAWGWASLETLAQDLRYALRTLRKNPGFTAVAVLTLALGIGANTAIFSVVDAVLLRPLPFKEPERLVMIWKSNPQRGIPYMFASPPEFADWREQNRAFEGISAFTLADLNLAGGAEPERVHGVRVSANLFSLLGAEPTLGRAFRAEEDQPAGPRAVVLAHSLWQRLFGGSPRVLGETLALDGETHTVIGVMPRGFQFPPPIALEGIASPLPAELWVPLRLHPDPTARGAHYLSVIGRIRGGISPATAQSDMTAIARRLAQEYPRTNAGWDIAVVPLTEQVFGKVRPALVALLGAVGFVLLIACANVANLMLARGAARQREMGIRAALGAGRGRLVRQLLTESALLALLGGVAGLLLSRWAVPLVTALGPAGIPRLEEVRADWALLGFALAVTALAVLLFGLAPALEASRPQRLAEGFGGRGSGASPAPHRLRRALVAAELALSLILLVGAGLLFQSFLRLRSVPLGFQPENVVTLSVRLPQATYREDQQRVRFFDEMHRRIAALPGVRSAGFINTIPLGSDRQGTVFVVEGRPAPPPGQENRANFSLVSHDYFRAMGIALVRGRLFTAGDAAGTEPVVLVSETLVRHYFPNEDPVGRRLILAGPRRIVGVVADERHDSLEAGFRPNLYLPYAQAPGARSLTLVLRSGGDPALLVPAVRAQLRELDPGLPLYDVRTMNQVLTVAAAQPRLQTCLFLVFAGIALALAVVGVYGVVSYSVTERFHEIGVRMALGARAPEIFGMIVRQVMRLALAGITAGLAGAFLLTRYVSALLFEVSAADPLTFAAVPLILAVTALSACCVPARRATKVDPMEALRYE